MEQEKSFLEEDSFMDLPPLKRVDQSLALQELGTMFLCDDFGNEIKNQEFVFLSEYKLLVLDRTYHRVLVVHVADKAPYLKITASHMLDCPIFQIAVLSDMRFAGLVRTKSKKGIALYELPSVDEDSNTILTAKSFLESPYKLSKLCASRNRDKLYTACLVHGLSCLLTITAADCCLTVTTTRPISSITMEEGMKSDITDLQVSPDGQVVFLLDQGLGNISRVELPTGNCRSFGRDLSYEAAGLTFSADCVLLHHSYRTTVMTVGTFGVGWGRVCTRWTSVFVYCRWICSWVMFYMFCMWRVL